MSHRGPPGPAAAGRATGWARALGLLLLLSICAPAAAAPALIILGREGDENHRELVAAVRQRLGELLPGAEAHFTEPADWSPALPAGALLVLGGEASQRVAAAPPAAPALHLLVTAGGFERLYPAGRGHASAIHIDQPLPRIVRLIALALPERRRVASIHGPQSRAAIPALRAAARVEGIDLAAEAIEQPQELDAALGRLLEDGRVLLALPDPVAVSAANARSLLLGAFDRRAPVVGYSQAFVKAGALLAVHTTPAQLGRQAAEALVPVLREGAPLPAPLHPRYFSVAANFQVARSLDIQLPSEEELAGRLRRVEGMEP